MQLFFFAEKYCTGWTNRSFGVKGLLEILVGPEIAEATEMDGDGDSTATRLSHYCTEPSE
jgi:hypothetical protein